MHLSLNLATGDRQTDSCKLRMKQRRSFLASSSESMFNMLVRNWLEMCWCACLANLFGQTEFTCLMVLPVLRQYLYLSCYFVIFSDFFSWPAGKRNQLLATHAPQLVPDPQLRHRGHHHRDGYDLNDQSIRKMTTEGI